MIGDRVRDRRLQLGLRQVELAKQAGITQPSLSAIERGDSKTVKGNTLMRLAAALAINPEYLRTGRGSTAFPIDPNADESEALGIYRALPASLRQAWIESGHALVRSVRPSVADPFPAVPKAAPRKRTA